jgi:hypothetical protein
LLGALFAGRPLCWADASAACGQTHHDLFRRLTTLSAVASHVPTARLARADHLLCSMAQSHTDPVLAWLLYAQPITQLLNILMDVPETRQS